MKSAHSAYNFLVLFSFLFHNLCSLLSTWKVRAVSGVLSATSPSGQLGGAIESNQAKYFDLLARYYVSKRQHVLAAHVLLRLGERRSNNGGDAPTLEQRLHLL